jgi:hypothetical protein
MVLKFVYIIGFSSSEEEATLTEQIFKKESLKKSVFAIEYSLFLS